MNNVLTLLGRKLKYLQRSLSGQYDFLHRDVTLRKKWLGNYYGGFFVASDFVNSASIVYSFGIGEDLSFDRALSDAFGCNVMCFDPTPKSLAWVEAQPEALTRHLKIFPYGLARKTHIAELFLPKNKDHVSGSIVAQSVVDTGNSVHVELKSIRDILAETGHNKIDVLKMDIEGAEYEFIDGLAASGVTVGQLLVEFHGRFFPNEPSKTRNAVGCLRDNGYRLFACSDLFEEVSFIHESRLTKGNA